MKWLRAMSHEEAAQLMPYRGPCELCGHPDARHRVADAIADRIAAGEPVDEVLADYGLEALRAFQNHVSEHLRRPPVAAEECDDR